MYSIIKQSGMQFKAEKGDKIIVPHFQAEINSELEIKDVLLFSGNKTHIGKPVLQNAVVKAKVLEHGKEEKVTVFKRKRRKRYRKTIGHRQQYTKLEIMSMECSDD
jgi:large subunit ribosomal protein L21